MVDEAYIAFGGESSVKLIADFPNLLVIHTLSKSHSLAGSVSDTLLAIRN